MSRPKTGNVGVTLSVNEQTFTALAVAARDRGMQVRDLMREVLDNAARVYDGSTSSDASTLVIAHN